MAMLEDQILPQLKEAFQLPHILHQTLITYGIGESNLADLLVDFENELPKHIKLAYLPNHGLVRLRLSANGPEEITIKKETDLYFHRMAELVKPYLIATEDASMEKILGDLLLQNHQTIGTAESCTGGYIAHLISSIPGASSYYKGSIVCYDNDIKSSLLGVPPSTIAQEGAVSEAVVKAMAEGLLTTMKTDYAIAVSGIMGPDGGSEEKPVGTVWIAVSNSQEIRTQKLRLRFNRQKNIQLTAMNALLLMRNMIAERN